MIMSYQQWRTFFEDQDESGSATPMEEVCGPQGRLWVHLIATFSALETVFCGLQISYKR